MKASNGANNSESPAGIRIGSGVGLRGCGCGDWDVPSAPCAEVMLGIEPCSLRSVATWKV